MYMRLYNGNREPNDTNAPAAIPRQHCMINPKRWMDTKEHSGIWDGTKWKVDVSDEGNLFECLWNRAGVLQQHNS